MLILLRQVADGAEKQMAEDLEDRHHELCVSEMPVGLDEGIRRLARKPSIAYVLHFVSCTKETTRISFIPIRFRYINVLKRNGYFFSIHLTQNTLRDLFLVRTMHCGHRIQSTCNQNDKLDTFP